MSRSRITEVCKRDDDQYRDRKIHQVDPETGAILRTIESNRFVTGVTWVDGELWHGTSEGDESEIRRIDPQTGTILESIDMPAGVHVSGLESDGVIGSFAAGDRAGRFEPYTGRGEAPQRPDRNSLELAP